MALIQDGNASGNLATVNNYKAIRVSQFSTELLNMETYCMQSGALAGVAANAPIYSLRNASPNLIAIRKLSLNVVVTTGFTAAQLVDFGAFIARNFTVADSGGNAVNITGNNNKHRTAHQSLNSNVDIRIATTAALTVGTRTLDAQPIGMVGAWTLAAAASTLIVKTPIIDIKDAVYPIILANNEGIVITPLTALGAAGVLRFYVDVELAEIDPAKFVV